MMTRKGRWCLIIILVWALAVIALVIHTQVIDDKKIIQEEVDGLEPVTEEPAPIQEPEDEITIKISRFDFDKSEITIRPGTTVIWENTDDRNHMITNPKLGLFRSTRKSLRQGDTFEYTFTEPGTYEILEANFGIKGLIIVEEPQHDMITGYIVKQIELNGFSFMLISLNLFLITAIVLVVAYYISRHRK